MINTFRNFIHIIIRFCFTFRLIYGLFSCLVKVCKGPQLWSSPLAPKISRTSLNAGVPFPIPSPTISLVFFFYQQRYHLFDINRQQRRHSGRADCRLIHNTEICHPEIKWKMLWGPEGQLLNTKTEAEVEQSGNLWLHVCLVQYWVDMLHRLHYFFQGIRGWQKNRTIVLQVSSKLCVETNRKDIPAGYTWTLSPYDSRRHSMQQSIQATPKQGHQLPSSRQCSQEPTKWNGSCMIPSKFQTPKTLHFFQIDSMGKQDRYNLSNEKNRNYQTIDGIIVRHHKKRLEYLVPQYM